MELDWHFDFEHPLGDVHLEPEAGFGMLLGLDSEITIWTTGELGVGSSGGNSVGVLVVAIDPMIVRSYFDCTYVLFLDYLVVVIGVCTPYG
jgi:hypothetical protein